MKHLYSPFWLGMVFLLTFWSCNLQEFEIPDQSHDLDPVHSAQEFYLNEKKDLNSLHGRI